MGSDLDEFVKKDNNIDNSLDLQIKLTVFR